MKQESEGSVERELLFRRHCEERVRGSIPALLGSGPGVLVLEDVAPAEQGDVLHGCSQDQAEAVVLSVARVHQASWNVSDDAFPADLPRWAPRAHDAEVWADRLARASERFPQLLNAQRRARLRRLPAEVENAVEHLRSGPASWIQVDAHLDNVLWRPQGDAVLVDWSQAAIGPPAVDLTRVLVEGVATPGTAAPLVSRYVDELGRGTAPELREAMTLALTPLVQGGVAWAGREDLERDGRPAALCENLLRGVLEWFDAAPA